MVDDDTGAKPPTIYDVAAACGVAPSTVSRAFSRPGRVAAATAARIHEVAEQMGYRSNPFAQALQGSRTKLVALVASDLTNPFFFEIIRGAERAAAEQDYTLLVADVNESTEVERQALDRTAGIVEGIVLATSRLSDTSIRAIARRQPAVVLNRVVTDVPSVVTDNGRGMRRAVEHLAELDHRTITYLAGPEASWADGMRWRAAQEAGHELGLRVRRLGPFAPTIDGGRAAARAFAEARTTAVVAYNDLIAIGFMQTVQSWGVAVPGDVSVVGFDDIFGADFCSPALTTVAAPLAALGKHAVTMLVEQLSTVGLRGARTVVPRRPALLPAALRVRESTGPRPRRQRAWTPTPPAG
ncbi:LacI family transcriptional regulator [Sanguibacter hominis ATCC BAA-789]|uniref:LacI family transcriptional regulator n=1 Tax=Sanguibacter hominis ATCC BAA-789 TaxID=1312740 RepID=A0A9X5FEP4_9MICO|nr:LacI family DNA-binding transcriptional regulator [Sanguibacter hominis]NKX92849.1 LacI family transcriptional regulator [Sanguibacter hominis ATCC BAA-789]